MAEDAVEIAGVDEALELSEAADEFAVDEDLREGAVPGLVDDTDFGRSIFGEVVVLEGELAIVEERFGGARIGAVSR